MSTRNGPPRGPHSPAQLAVLRDWVDLLRCLTTLDCAPAEFLDAWARLREAGWTYDEFRTAVREKVTRG